MPTHFVNPSVGVVAAAAILLACGAVADADDGDAGAGEDAAATTGGAPGPTGGTPTGGEPGGAGGQPAQGGAPADCDPVDTACPGARPLADTPCTAGLTCAYEPTRADAARYALTCPEGRWVETVDCSLAAPGGVCGLPVFAESCERPTSGGLDGYAVSIGPAVEGESTFRPFMPEELVAELVGGQGSPMLPFRVELSGGDAAPPLCIELSVQLAMVMATEPAPAAAVQNVLLRCGTSNRVYVIDTLPLPEGRNLIDVTVSVSGGGTTTARLAVDAAPQFGR